MLVTSIYTVTTYVALLMLIAWRHTSLPSPGRPNRVEDEQDLHGESWVLPNRPTKQSRYVHSRHACYADMACRICISGQLTFWQFMSDFSLGQHTAYVGRLSRQLPASFYLGPAISAGLLPADMTLMSVPQNAAELSSYSARPLSAHDTT